jgi:hypothetical protein
MGSSSCERDRAAAACTRPPPDWPCTIGIRAHELSLDPLPGTVTIPSTTRVAEVTRSDSYIRLDVGGISWVMLAPVPGDRNRARRRRSGSMPAAALPSARMGLGDTRKLTTLRHGARSRLPGIVLMRERPGSSKVVIFIWGLTAPAGTLPEIVEQVNAAGNRLLEEPETRKRIVDSGADVLGGTPTPMGEFYASERERLGRVARDANIRLE